MDLKGVKLLAHPGPPQRLFPSKPVSVWQAPHGKDGRELSSHPQKRTRLRAFSASRVLLPRRGTDSNTPQWDVGRPFPRGPCCPEDSLVATDGQYSNGSATWTGSEIRAESLQDHPQHGVAGLWDNQSHFAFQARRATRRGPGPLVIIVPRALASSSCPALQTRPSMAGLKPGPRLPARFCR